MRNPSTHSHEVWELLSLLLDHNGNETETYLRDELERADDDACRAAWGELLQALAELRVRPQAHQIEDVSKGR